MDMSWTDTYRPKTRLHVSSAYYHRLWSANIRKLAKDHKSYGSAASYGYVHSLAQVLGNRIATHYDVAQGSRWRAIRAKKSPCEG
jgi:hypothetical protein